MCKELIPFSTWTNAPTIFSPATKNGCGLAEFVANSKTEAQVVSTQGCIGKPMTRNSPRAAMGQRNVKTQCADDSGMASEEHSSHTKVNSAAYVYI